MPCTKPTLRPLCLADLPALLTIQRQCYPPEMNEDETTWCKRLSATAAFAWVAEIDRKVCAYLATYPSHLGKVTPLGGEFVLSETADCLYFHDLAVAPSAAGRGLGAALAGQALQAAREHGLAHAALVCVQDALSFWQRQGFVEYRALTPAGDAALSTYPGPARYLSRPAG